jgi:hypothetical protein
MGNETTGKFAVPVEGMRIKSRGRQGKWSIFIKFQVKARAMEPQDSFQLKGNTIGLLGNSLFQSNDTLSKI